MTPPAKLPILRYVEWLSRGRRTGRVAYVLDEWDLPSPQPGAEWVLDKKFVAAEAARTDPTLKNVFRSAIKNRSMVVLERD